MFSTADSHYFIKMRLSLRKLLGLAERQAFFLPLTQRPSCSWASVRCKLVGGAKWKKRCSKCKIKLKSKMLKYLLFS